MYFLWKRENPSESQSKLKGEMNKFTWKAFFLISALLRFKVMTCFNIAVEQSIWNLVEAHFGGSIFESSQI